jgi:DNA-binding Lrp family transcriptional regulator
MNTRPNIQGGNGRDIRHLLLARLERLIERLPPHAVNAALATDDLGTFVALASPENWPDAEVSAADRARLRGMERKNELLAQAGRLSVAEAALRLGVTREAVRKRLRSGSLLGIPIGRGYAIPAIQFTDRAVVSGLGQVLKAMPIDSPWMKLEWLLSPEPRLKDRVPIAVLAQTGERDTVIAAARMVGLHGAA